MAQKDANAKPKSPVLRFRVSAEQEEHAKKAAADAGYDNLSDYLRTLCLERTVVTLNGNDVVLIPPASSTTTADEEVMELLQEALATVQSKLAGEGEEQHVDAAPPDSAPTSGEGEVPVVSSQEPLDASAQARPEESAGSTPDPETGAAPSTEEPATPSGRDPSAPSAAGGGLAAEPPAADLPAAPAPTYERFPPETPVPPGTQQIVLPFDASRALAGEMPGDYWLGRAIATGELFVAVIGGAAAPEPLPVPPSPPAELGAHPFDSLAGAPPAVEAQPAQPTPPVDAPPAVPPEDPGPTNERGENFTEFVNRRAAELEGEGRPPVVAQQEAAAEWRKQGNG